MNRKILMNMHVASHLRCSSLLSMLLMGNTLGDDASAHDHLDYVSPRMHACRVHGIVRLGLRQKHRAISVLLI